jgi:hypothetical protein
MIKQFYDRNHAAAYLSNTLIRYDGKPMVLADLVGEDDGGMRYWLRDQTDVGGDAGVWTNDDDPLLDMSPLPSGFMTRQFGDVTTRCCAIKRFPSRQWKVGTSLNAVQFYDVDTGMALGKHYGDLVSHGLMQLLNKTYLSFDAVVERYSSSRVSLPFSRMFAVSPAGQLRHLLIELPIGEVEDGQVVLFDNFAYMQEALQEDIRYGND